MAITQIGAPQDFTPAYNNIFWYFNSDNKNITGFRYICDIYRKTGPSTETLIKRLRIPPAPSTGYCHLEISKTIQSFLTSELPNYSSFGDPTSSYIRYNLKIGEEYQTEWTYDDFQFYSSTPTDPFNGYVKLVILSSPAVPHTFVVGDQINIFQEDGGVEKPAISGLHTVVAVPDEYTIVIDIPFSVIGSGPEIGGEVTYFDNRKTIYSDLLTISDKCAYNAAIPHMQFNTYVDDNYQPSSLTPCPALSTLPNVFTVRDDQSFVINWLSSYFGNFRWIYFLNSKGTTRRTNIYNNAIPLTKTAVGPNNIMSTTLVSGTGQIVEDDVDWYEFWITDVSDNRVTEVYRFEIDRSYTKFDKYNLCFLDRMGSISSFFFLYDSTIQGSITRTDSNFLLGGLSGSKWTYNSTDAGYKVLNVDTTKEYTLNTAWLSQEESNHFIELLSTPNAWILLNGEYWPIIVTDTSYVRGSINTTKNIRYSIKVRLANNDSINW